MMRAYKEIYLNNAANTFGCMMHFAVNDCKLDGDDFLQMFCVSGLAEQFAHGNPKIIAGKSGIELAQEVIYLIKGEKSFPAPSMIEDRSPEFWAGWALAQYQWHTAKSFALILQALPFTDMVRMYPTFHEADITKFFIAANEAYRVQFPKTNLKRIRETAGLSQAQLAKESDVSLRSVQMYEQRNKDINKAQAITLIKIARTLGCQVEGLLESEI